MNVYPLPYAEKETSMSESNGTVKATMHVQVTGFSGVTRMRRVTIGQEFLVGRDTAKGMAQKVRELNRDYAIRVQYTEEM